MTRRRRKKPRRTRRKKSGTGRFIEGMSVLVLFLVVLVFGISIASRFLPGDERTEGQSEVNLDPESETEDSRLLTTLETGRPVIVVENGCGTPGLARDFSDEVREPFDVMDYRDADRYDYDQTVIVASKAHQEEARVVLRQLEARYKVGRIDLSLEPSVLAPVRVILGRDLAEVWARRGTLTSGTR